MGLGSAVLGLWTERRPSGGRGGVGVRKGAAPAGARRTCQHPADHTASLRRCLPPCRWAAVDTEHPSVHTPVPGGHKQRDEAVQESPRGARSGQRKGMSGNEERAGTLETSE